VAVDPLLFCSTTVSPPALNDPEGVLTVPRELKLTVEPAKEALAIVISFPTDETLFATVGSVLIVVWMV